MLTAVGVCAVDARHRRRKRLDSLFTVDGKRAPVAASSMIFRALDGEVFNTHARYRFGLSEDQDRGWVIDRINQTVPWNEGNPDIHAASINHGLRASDATGKRYKVHLRGCLKLQILDPQFLAALRSPPAPPGDQCRRTMPAAQIPVILLTSPLPGQTN